MDKGKKTGIILAVVLLIFAVCARYMPGVSAKNIMLPVLAIICGALSVIDIAVLKKHKGESGAVTYIVRAITFGVAAIVLLAAVINFIL